MLHSQETPDPLCVAVEKTPIPKMDLPNEKAPDKCDAFSLYYSGGAPNLHRAGVCALQTVLTLTTSEDDTWGDLLENGVLAMMYAEGKGVAPNLRLAERFACQMNDWGQDGRGIAHSFEEQRKQGATTVKFDLCKDGVLGRITNYVCLVRDQSIVAGEVARAVKLFNTGPPEQQAAFRRVLATRKAYISAHDHEEPNGTTGAVQSAMADEIEIEREWARTLTGFRRGYHLPNFTSQDFRKADTELNAVYKVARANTTTCNDPMICLSAGDLVKVERAWIAYRDAWVAYATLRWPAVAADSFRAWLTLAQTDDLKNVAD